MTDGPDCTCGGAIPSSRRDGFCSSWCRGRDEQGLPALSPPPLLPPTVLVPVAAGERAAVEGEVSAEDQRPHYRLRRRKIADEIEDRLRKAGLLDHWQAATVLDLADSLDWTGGSLSARAAGHRELHRQMSDMLRGQDEAGSAVGSYRDELAKRRQRRAGGDAG